MGSIFLFLFSYYFGVLDVCKWFNFCNKIAEKGEKKAFSLFPASLVLSYTQLLSK